MFYLHFTFLTILFSHVNGLLSDFHIPKYSNALTQATVEIIEKFYLTRTATINFYHASIDDVDENYKRNLDTMNEILYKIQSDVVVQLEGYLDFKVTNRKRVYNIFFVDSYESLWNILRIMSPFFFDYQGFYLIVLTTYSDEQYRIMMQTFEVLWAEYVINVNIIWLAPENDNEAIMYTYFPYTSFFCGKALPIQLNQFYFGKWLHTSTDFFPKKVSNMYGCPLKVATVFTAPFMIIQHLENGTIRPDGIDGVVLRVLSQRMNFSIDLVQVESQGLIKHNGKKYEVTGAFKMVIEKEANFTIGYMSSTVIRNLFMSSSYIYFTSNLVWITPPGRLTTSFEKLFKPFGIILWSCILCLFVFGYLVIKIVKQQVKPVQVFVFGRSNTTPCLNAINVFFGGSLPRLPLRNFARTLLGLFMIYCLIIRSSYTGALFTFMKSASREQEVETIAEMIDQDFKFYVLDSSREYITALPQVLERTVYIERDDLQKIRDNLLDPEFKGALLSSEEHTAFLNEQVFPDLYFYYANEIISVFNLCIYLHRQSCLTEEINQNILNFKSSGLMDAWTKEFVDYSYLKELKFNEPKVLVFSQILGAYEILFVGFLLSLATFCVELFSVNRPKLRRIVENN